MDSQTKSRQGASPFDSGSQVQWEFHTFQCLCDYKRIAPDFKWWPIRNVNTAAITPQMVHHINCCRVYGYPFNGNIPVNQQITIKMKIHRRRLY